MILVEGIFDVLNLHDKGLPNAVCCFGTRNISVEKLPEVIVDISNGAYQDVLCVDKEINFIATISNILRRI